MIQNIDNLAKYYKDTADKIEELSKEMNGLLSNTDIELYAFIHLKSILSGEGTDYFRRRQIVDKVNLEILISNLNEEKVFSEKIAEIYNTSIPPCKLAIESWVRKNKTEDDYDKYLLEVLSKRLKLYATEEYLVDKHTTEELDFYDNVLAINLIKYQAKVDELESAMKRAIKQEKYEKAAELKIEIEKLKEKQ